MNTAMPSTHRGGCATALLLFLAASASGADDDIIPSDIGALHAEAQQRWQTQRAHRYLDDIGNERRRAVVGRVCGGIQDEEERWMCEKRGAHLAERLGVYTSVSRTDLAEMIESFEGPYKQLVPKAKRIFEAGMWFSIVDGKLDKWGRFGCIDTCKDMWNLALGRVLECIKKGAIVPGQTFDWVLQFGDGGEVSPGSPLSSGLPQYPIAKYSYTPTNEPYYFPLPWFELWQLEKHLPRRRYLPFEKLKRRAITRNDGMSLPRILASMLTGAKYTTMLDASMVNPHRKDAETNYKACETLLPQLVASLKAEHARSPSFDLDAVLERLADTDVHALCGRLVYNGGFIDWDTYVSYRYLLSPDWREAAVSRFWMLMRAPGVTMPILESRKTFQEYYFRDAVPFLHYVPVTDDVAALTTNLTASLQWLEENEGTAKYIGEESTRWAHKHKTHKTDMRQWKLYFALLSDMYVPANGTRNIIGRVHKEVECTERAEKFLFYGETGCVTESGKKCAKWPRVAWDFACGRRKSGGSIVGELRTEWEEAADEAVGLSSAAAAAAAGAGGAMAEGSAEGLGDVSVPAPSIMSHPALFVVVLCVLLALHKVGKRLS